MKLNGAFLFSVSGTVYRSCHLAGVNLFFRRAYGPPYISIEIKLFRATQFYNITDSLRVRRCNWVELTSQVKCFDIDNVCVCASEWVICLCEFYNYVASMRSLSSMFFFCFSLFASIWLLCCLIFKLHGTIHFFYGYLCLYHLFITFDVVLRRCGSNVFARFWLCKLLLFLLFFVLALCLSLLLMSTARILSFFVRHDAALSHQHRKHIKTMESTCFCLSFRFWNENHDGFGWSLLYHSNLPLCFLLC